MSVLITHRETNINWLYDLWSHWHGTEKKITKPLSPSFFFRLGDNIIYWREIKFLQSQVFLLPNIRFDSLLYFTLAFIKILWKVCIIRHGDRQKLSSSFSAMTCDDVARYLTFQFALVLICKNVRVRKIEWKRLQLLHMLHSIWLVTKRRNHCANCKV